MSRIGKLPIEIPSGVTVDIKDNFVTVKGSLGELSFQFDNLMVIEINEKEATVKRANDEKRARELHGLSRTLLANMIQGVSKGFERRLEVNGVGYKAKLAGKNLDLALGYSHPIKVEPPEGITFEIDGKKQNIIVVKGISKQKVGQVAANIRSHRKPEPYKGKGVKYIEERIIRKVGKAAGKEG
jgi:large subunit ribosomal protein L6